jgi:predicted ATP-dependent endonuclease of OLD family
VFIEEPEKLLHPGLQRRLIETLMKQEGFENYQYFMTTHSNHFLDITLDFPEISIYTLTKKIDEGAHDEKDSKFLIENLKHGDTSVLELLGVRDSSVFLSNCTIWVEGITDRLYFRHYLNLYFDNLSKNNNSARFKEDFHYSFVKYSGGIIAHWSFLDNE